MRHLYNSVVKVQRLLQTQVNGVPMMDWVDAIPRVKCRLDLNFMRPGKDELPAIVAGRAPDRVGVMFCDVFPLIAGDRIVTIPDDKGRMEVEGTFDIKSIPDRALGYRRAHHIEVQVVETNQLLTGKFPYDNEDD